MLRWQLLWRTDMINELIKRYPALEQIRDDIIKAAKEITDCYENGGKLLMCGNGGSAADCEHIAGELMKGFLKKRPLSDEKKQELKENMPLYDAELLSGLQCGLTAISLPSMTALNSAFCNDADPRLIYAQAVFSLAKKGDVLIAISTSGNSCNVCAAANIARAAGCRVIGLTGCNGGRLREYADICICVPEDETFKIQELHLPVYHCICATVEEHFFKE